jgi:hypothetical protein
MGLPAAVRWALAFGRRRGHESGSGPRHGRGFAPHVRRMQRVRRDR